MRAAFVRACFRALACCTFIQVYSMLQKSLIYLKARWSERLRPRFRMVIAAGEMHGGRFLPKGRSIGNRCLRVDLLANGFSWLDRFSSRAWGIHWLVYLLLLGILSFGLWQALVGGSAQLTSSVLEHWLYTLFVVAMLAIGLAVNRRLIRFYVLLYPSGTPLPDIVSTHTGSRDEPVYICRYSDSADEPLAELSDFLVLYDVDIHERLAEKWASLRRIWAKRIQGRESDRRKLTPDTEDWLWSLARLSLQRMLTIPPRPDSNEGAKINAYITPDALRDVLHERDAQKEKNSFFLPFKLHLTQFKFYLLLLASVFVYGIYIHYSQDKLVNDKNKNAASITMHSQVEASEESSGAAIPNCAIAHQNKSEPCKKKLSYSLDVTATQHGKLTSEGTLAIPVAAFVEMVRLHGIPVVLGGLGIVWTVFFIWSRPKQLRSMESWYDRTMGQPPNKGKIFLLRRDLKPSMQWEEIPLGDFCEKSIEEFGPDDEKVWHLADGVLLVLLFEAIHLVH